MKVYYKESPVGEIRVDEDEGHSGPYGSDESVKIMSLYLI
jgi:hypothetical protein